MFLQKYRRHWRDWLPFIILIMFIAITAIWAFYNKCVQEFFWLAMVATSVFAAYKIPIELSQGLKWRKTEMAKKIHDDMMLHEGAKNAREMLDYHSGRHFEITQYSKNGETREKEEVIKEIKIKEIKIEDVITSLNKRDGDPLERV